jgi:hypothetical protein
MKLDYVDIQLVQNAQNSHEKNPPHMGWLSRT